MDNLMLLAGLVGIGLFIFANLSKGDGEGVLKSTAQPASQPKSQLLWPDGAPKAKGKSDADKPAIFVHLPPPDKANGAAMVICPGGGFNTLMMSYEGHDIAKWLNGFGIAGIVLKYRVRYSHPVPMLDVQRAMRTVRANAKQWNIDSSRIGVIGFSAGGHVAAMAGTHFDDGDPKSADPIERVSSRPDLMVLIYPVITMGEKGHAGVIKTLLGHNPSAEDIDFISAEKQVTDKTPPAFLAHSKVDEVVPVVHSELFYDALKAKNIPAEILKLETGKHGLGCGKGEEWTAWQQKAMEWIKTMGFLKAGEK